MLTAYIHAAMQHAQYKQYPEDGMYFGEIPLTPGVWATGETLDACKAALQDVLEGWIILGLRFGDSLPVIDGIDINPHEDAA